MVSFTKSEGVTAIICFIFDHLAEKKNAINLQDEKPLWTGMLVDISWKRQDLNRDLMHWKEIDSWEGGV